MQIDGCCLDAAVVQKPLDTEEINAGLQQVRREAVPQRVRGDPSVQARPLGSALQQEPEPLSG